ncbi:hypothetical protein V5O48_005478 [Marasmius crinis-equi]|uniref:Uncharacterized protein n=1 Tax=Marasmius crinis-equi TaxID=585013 RepID=A0ABR3FM48_9AGAR
MARIINWNIPLVIEYTVLPPHYDTVPSEGSTDDRISTLVAYMMQRYGWKTRYRPHNLASDFQRLSLHIREPGTLSAVRLLKPHVDAQLKKLLESYWSEPSLQFADTVGLEMQHGPLPPPLTRDLMREYGITEDSEVKRVVDIHRTAGTSCEFFISEMRAAFTRIPLLKVCLIRNRLEIDSGIQ